MYPDKLGLIKIAVQLFLVKLGSFLSTPEKLQDSLYNKVKKIY